MPRFGELLFDGLRNVEGIRPDFLHALRLEGNRLDSVASTVQEWVGTTGDISPDMFQRFRPMGFSVLPHECAMLFQGSDSGAQTIPDDSWTKFTNFDAPSVSGTATFELGIKTDAANGEIDVSSAPRDHVFMIFGRVSFDANATGIRGVRWVDSASGSIRSSLVQAVDGVNETDVSVLHFRSPRVDDSSYYLEVYQNSGGNLDVPTFSGLLFVARIR